MEGASKCDLCSVEFDSLNKLNVHIKQKHMRVRESKKKTFKCNVCGYEFSRGDILINHIRTHTGERPFKCEASGCGVAFAKESTLRTHFKLKHSDERPFKCQVRGCGITFKLGSRLNTHIKFKHSDERPFKCDVPGCLQTNKTLSDFLKHKTKHSDERPFACPHTGCGFRAKSKSNITRHVKCVHSESRTFAGTKCDYKTTHSASLKLHMRRHSRRRHFKCGHPQCTASFKHSSDLKRHCRNLHGNKTIQCDCPGCGQYLTTSAALKDHLKLHNSSGRAFQCPLCFKHFARLHQLQEHCVVHTSEKPFQCGHCKHEAASRAQVKSHISSVHADTEFPFIAHLLGDHECLHCKIILPNAEFVVYCKDQHHVEHILIN